MFTISRWLRKLLASRGLLAAVLVAASLFASWSGAASAKIIGIVADDSGSMRGKQYLPGFGAQVLAATIDGRPSQDRLFVMRLNEIYVSGQAIPQNLGSTGAKRATIQSLQSLFHGPKPDSGTPYDAVDIMLRKLSEEARPGEAAHLIVLTDGSFSQPPNPAELRQRYARVRGGLKGTLKVDFIAIFPQDPAQKAQFKTDIQTQGVKDALLSVFNGSPNEGYWPVEDADDLWRALRSIISNISDTDPAASARYVDYKGSQIKIESPFSIERIVVTSTKETSRGGKAPKYQSGDLDSFNPDRETYTVGMPAPDSQMGNVRMEGESNVFRFTNGLRPGTYTLNFSGPTENDVFLLFDIKSTTVLRILDEAGQEPQKNSSGAYVLIKDTPYTFVAQIADPLVPGGVINFSQIDPNTSFELFITAQGGGPGQTLSMDKDISNNAATATYAPSQTGLFNASALTRMPGFATPQSEDLRIEVLDTVAQITLSPFEPAENCGDCASDEVQSSLTPNSPDMPVGSFTVTPQAGLPGAIQFKSKDFSPFMYLQDESGQRIPFDEDIPMQPGEDKKITVMRDGILDPNDISTGSADISLSVAPSGGWTGDAADLDMIVKLRVPKLIMELVSHSSDPVSGSGPLILNDRELLRGQFEAVFRFRDMITVFDPDRSSKDFDFNTEGLLAPLMSYRVITSPPGSTNVTAQVRPSTQFWCLCLFGLSNYVSSDQRNVTVSFEDAGRLQRAKARLPMQIEVAGRVLMLSCLLDLLILFLLYVFVSGLIGWMQTRRFPRNSAAIIREGRNMPSIEDLRGRNLTWLRCWQTFLLGPPHERAYVSDMVLEASMSGPVLILGKNDPPAYESQFFGQKLEDFILPGTERHQFSWGETLTDVTNRRRTIKFVADYDDEN